MNFRQLRYFIAVAEEENIGRAAARLHISQPPLTRQIRQLETEMDVVLFHRTPKGMELTAAGRLFLDEARNIRSVVEQATERTQRAAQGKLGRLDIGIFGSAILGHIPRLILEFRNRYPEVNIVLHTMSKQEQIVALRRRSINIGFNRMLAPQPDIVSEVVLEEDLLLAVNVNHPYARRKSVRFGDIEDQPLVLFPSGARPGFIDKVEGLCHERGFAPKISQEVGDVVTGVALVAGGFGLCLVSASVTVLTLPGVVFLPIDDLPPHARVDLSCIYRSGDESPILKLFLEVLREKA